jgi:hypothetical protein
VVDSGGVLYLPEAGKQVDEDQRVVAGSGAWSSSSVSSSSEERERLEGSLTSGALGEEVCDDFLQGRRS